MELGNLKMSYQTVQKKILTVHCNYPPWMQIQGLMGIYFVKNYRKYKK